MTTASGVPRLLEGPVWTALTREESSPGRRRLDLRTGVLHWEVGGGDFSSLRFASMPAPA
jgi:hypothetical protein